jgi:cytochrome c biogenesis protein CcmG/thiol:disulfide interchange protein DsbE
MENNNESNHAQWTNQRLASLGSDSEWNPDASAGLSLLKAKVNADARRRQRRMWAAGAAGLVCVAVLAFPVTRAFAERCVDACVDQTSRVSGLLLGRFSSHPAPASSGLASSIFTSPGGRRSAPDFTLSDESGKAVRLSDFRGRAVLLNFWATWCAPCKLEVPWFIEFQKNYRDRGLAVVGVAMDEEGWKAVTPYVEAAKVNYTVVIGNDAVSQAFGGIESLPATILIDKAGRIASVHVGLCAKGDYEAEIKALVEE